MTNAPFPNDLHLNQRACAIIDDLVRDPERFRIAVERVEGGGRVLDAGVRAPGGLEAGIQLVRICLAGLGTVSIVPGDEPLASCPRIQVFTDHPVAACMASQYAGWQISTGKFFAMGSGPMRAAYGGEELFQHIGFRETADVAAGVLETSALPGPEVFRFLAEKTRVEPSRITLAVASTRSIAGSVQVVARSVETALHKLHTLGFDVSKIESGLGTAPLPPPAKDDLTALGRANDAVLYGGRVTLWARASDELLAAIGPRVPSSSSRDFGEPFGRIFERYGRDFYKVDPALFSPAEVTFQNLESGRTHRFGGVAPAVLSSSFFK